MGAEPFTPAHSGMLSLGLASCISGEQIDDVLRVSVSSDRAPVIGALPQGSWRRTMSSIARHSVCASRILHRCFLC